MYTHEVIVMFYAIRTIDYNNTCNHRYRIIIALCNNHTDDCNTLYLNASAPRQMAPRAPSFGWHYLSNATRLMRPRSFYAMFIVSRTTIVRNIIRHSWRTHALDKWCQTSSAPRVLPRARPPQTLQVLRAPPVAQGGRGHGAQGDLGWHYLPGSL